MLDVIIALIPAGLAGCVIFGGRALLVIGLCVFFSVHFEYASRSMADKNTAPLLASERLPVGMGIIYKSFSIAQ